MSKSLFKAFALFSLIVCGQSFAMQRIGLIEFLTILEPVPLVAFEYVTAIDKSDLETNKKFEMLATMAYIFADKKEENGQRYKEITKMIERYASDVSSGEFKKNEGHIERSYIERKIQEGSAQELANLKNEGQLANTKYLEHINEAFKLQIRELSRENLLNLTVTDPILGEWVASEVTKRLNGGNSTTSSAHWPREGFLADSDGELSDDFDIADSGEEFNSDNYFTDDDTQEFSDDEEEDQ